MAEVRRPGSRRKTPTPQPEKPPARASRRLRSQSRDIEPIPDLQKPTRRSARQGSIPNDSDNEGLKSRKQKRKPANEAARDLSIVEEVDTEIAFGKTPATPQRIDFPLPAEQQTFRSPGAISQMSGTTAISSFSMIQADFLESKFMLKHVSKLCDNTQEFLEHLVPSAGSMDDDFHNMREMLKPDSDYVEEYHDLDAQFKLHLNHFKGEESNYINVRAVHRALFDSYNDSGAARSGINLVLYLANILVLAKQMITSDRSDKGALDRLRQLDNSFPGTFVHSLVNEGSTLAIGDSTLLGETFNLALELRTQLAVLSLQQSSSDADFEPVEALDAIFLVDDEVLIRGWNVAALGGGEASLPQEYQTKIVERYNEVREYLDPESQASGNGDVIDLEGLTKHFRWSGTVSQLLAWVRLRQNELNSAIDAIGGSKAILTNIKTAIAAPQPAPEEAGPVAAPRDSPRKKRLSFGRQRRRSGRKFDPNAPIDPRTISILKAKERDSGVFFNPKDVQAEDVFVQVAAEEEDSAQQTVAEEAEAEGEDVDARTERSLQEQINQMDDDNWVATLGGDDEPHGDATLVAGDQDIADNEANEPSGPPTSTQETLAALRSVQPAGKENRKGARFVDRQPNAVRLEFGDGWDSSQPTPGPSSRVLDKGKQRADPPPSVSRKRTREEDVEEDDEDHFQSGDRSAQVQERRQKAPVSKRARVEPPSSAPPSHQPVRATQTREPAADELRLPPSRQRAPASSAPAVPRVEPEESNSEQEAPEMTEPEPPRSAYQAQRQLALQNSAIGGAGRARQPRRTWTVDQEEAFIEYMAACQGSFKNIKDRDQGEEGYDLLDEFTQVNLKDKARSMAINMIKSGTGLQPGFEHIIKPGSKDGQRLLDQGFTW
ncbi:hypothetical protein E8E13_011231 [Curvularia kusanoi]|uniref:Myb-like domain-containing protein n=1 Tax=Curvularia kusanoi TaxID=90978 RepID=A0A9P4TQC2_CURKU|nr:hypothetical protein E8E13_011231 [Curvularia kusanoi]